MLLVNIQGDILDTTNNENIDYMVIKNELIDEFDFSYIEKFNEEDFDYINEYIIDDSDLIYNYNGHNYDEFDDYLANLSENGFYEVEEIVLHSTRSLYDPISVIHDGKRFLFKLNHGFSLYKCDKCKLEFLDYVDEYYDWASEKRSIQGDLCIHCYARNLKEFRKKVVRKALKKLEDNNGIKFSKQQLYLSKLYNGHLNKNIGGFYADIVLEDKKIIIEYDGSGHWMKTVFDDKLTKEDVDKRDIEREIILNQLGYRVLRIVSEKDLLPYDEVLLKVLSRAENHFEKGSMKYVVNVNETYKRNELRKIKNTDNITEMKEGK